MNITIYELLTGRITKTLDVNENNFLNDIELNVDDGESYINGKFSGNEYYIDGEIALPKGVAPNNFHIFDYDTKEWVDTRSASDIAADLAIAKRKAIAEINTAIGIVRGKYITIMPGQDMVYSAKEAEAIAYLADNTFDCPIISKEVGITAPTLYEVAQTIVNMSQMWRVVAGQLEELRLGHIAQIENSLSYDECENIMELFRDIVQTL